MFVVGQAGRGRKAGGVFAVFIEGIGLVAQKRGQLHAGEGAALPIAEQHALAVRGELEGRVQLAPLARGAAGGVDEQIAVAADDRALGEDEFL